MKKKMGLKLGKREAKSLLGVIQMSTKYGSLVRLKKKDIQVYGYAVGRNWLPLPSGEDALGWRQWEPGEQQVVMVTGFLSDWRKPRKQVVVYLRDEWYAQLASQIYPYKKKGVKAALDVANEVVEWYKEEYGAKEIARNLGLVA